MNRKPPDPSGQLGEATPRADGPGAKHRPRRVAPEQLELASDPEFWRMIAERRAQPTISRAELERRLESSAGHA